MEVVPVGNSHDKIPVIFLKPLKILCLDSTSHRQKRGKIIKNKVKKLKHLGSKLFVLNLRQKDNPKKYEKWKFQTRKDMTSTTEQTPLPGLCFS